jgi:hypothetical protein
LAALSAWWPVSDGSTATASSPVAVQAGTDSWCGRLADSNPGTLRIESGGQLVEVPLSSVTAIRAVSGCD